MSGLFRPKTHKEFISDSQQFHVWVSTKCGWSWNKIKSHTGVVGNERVDQVAKLGAAGICRVWAPQDFHNTVADCSSKLLKRLRILSSS